jgi:hypothetical protein
MAGKKGLIEKWILSLLIYTLEIVTPYSNEINHVKEKLKK